MLSDDFCTCCTCYTRCRPILHGGSAQLDIKIIKILIAVKVFMYLFTCCSRCRPNELDGGGAPRKNEKVHFDPGIIVKCQNSQRCHRIYSLVHLLYKVQTDSTRWRSPRKIKKYRIVNDIKGFLYLHLMYTVAHLMN